jgi:iron(III) transport system substrate-binding protein
MMRRSIYIFLFFIVLITPFVLRAMYSAAPPPTSTEALPLVIITPNDEGIRREFAQAFSRWHQQKFGQPIAIDYRNYGGTSSIVKFFEASRSLYQQIGTYKIDLAWGGGDFLFETQLKGEEFLQGLDLGADFMHQVFPQPKLAGLPLYDTGSPPQWFGAALSSFGICYNRDALKYLALPEPKTWGDLADSRYRGWIVLADPTQSASAKTAYMVLIERAMADAKLQGKSEDEGWAKGMGLLRQIAANARLFVDSGASPSGIVANGDVAASMVIDFYARATIEQVGAERMGYVEPLNATAINPDPIALVRGAEHRETAIRFIQFVLSDEGQKLWIVRAGEPGGPTQTSLRRLPIRKDVYEHPLNFSDNVNPFISASQFNTSNSRKKTFAFLGDLMQMSMIDLLDELRETRRVILASPRAAELDAKLGEFPFDQVEALRRADEYKNASAVQRMALQRQWTDEFRDEYRRLRQEAQQ